MIDPDRNLYKTHTNIYIYTHMYTHTYTHMSNLRKRECIV